MDGDFGLGGVAFASFNSVDVAHALAIRADDTITVVGCATTANGEVFAVAQFTADGEADAKSAHVGVSPGALTIARQRRSLPSS